MRKKYLIIAVCLVIAFLVAFGQYVDQGYVGAIQSGESVRLLDRGFHLRTPWHRVTFYPIRGGRIHLEIRDRGPDGEIHFDAVLVMSVRPAGIASLHRTYQGAYVERLISPLVLEFLKGPGDAPGLSPDGFERQRLTTGLRDHLNAALSEHQISVFQVWLRSFDVEPDPHRQL
jgi:hypothetical protein